MKTIRIVLLILIIIGLILLFTQKFWVNNFVNFILQYDTALPNPPDTQTKEGTTAVLNQKILNGGVYITPLQIVSDSRCPYGVQCIWAGEIILKVKLEKGGASEEVELKERGSVVFEGSTVSLTGVIPENKTKIPTPEKDYQFIFKVMIRGNQAATPENNLPGGVTYPAPPGLDQNPRPYPSPAPSNY